MAVTATAAAQKPGQAHPGSPGMSTRDTLVRGEMLGICVVEMKYFGGVDVQALDVTQIRFAVLVDFSDGDSVNIVAQSLFKESLFLVVWIRGVRQHL